METPSFAEKLQDLRDRYWGGVGPLLLLLGIGLPNSALLAWTAGTLLGLLTLNKLVPLLAARRRT